MRVSDVFRFTLESALSHRLRSALTALGIAIGVTAVVLLTSMGEGLRRYVLAEFTQFGTNIISVAPGKAITFGGTAGSGGSVKPLSIDDTEALRRVPYVLAPVPEVAGNAAVEGGGRSRRVAVFGTGHEMASAFSMPVRLGEFLPPDDPNAPRALAVLGSKLRDELYGEANPLGDKIRIGGERFRVVGVMETKGNMLGFDLDDTVYIPAARAMAMFNQESLQGVDVAYEEGAPVAEVEAGIKRVLIERHGNEDFTVVNQQQMLDVLGSVLEVVTFAVAALGAISLVVGGVGIFTIMTIAVRERTSEIGLLRALGASRDRIGGLFLGESVILSMVGGLSGLGIGLGLVFLCRLVFAGLPVALSVPYATLALVLSGIIGLVAGVLPARRAARMDPVAALRGD